MSVKRRIIPVFIPHMGCPNNCVFCNQRKISSTETPANADTVERAISAASRVIANTEAELAFYGGSFTAIDENTQVELLKSARPFLDRNNENSIRISTRPDCIDERIAGILKEYGVKTVELGAQSMCEDVLSQTKRGHTAEDVRKASDVVKGAGLNLILQMMTGLPGDTFERSVYTAKRFIEMMPDGVRIYPTVVVQGTELYDMWKRGEYREHTVDEAVELCAKLIDMYKEAKIPVIRLGLNPSEELTSAAAAAGAYHPAFGELVYSMVYYKNAIGKLSGVPRGSEVTLYVSKGRASVMTGQKRTNIVRLIEKYGLKSVKVLEDDIALWEIRVKWR